MLKNNKQMINFYDLSLNDLKEILFSWEIKSFREKQIINWIYKKNIQDFIKMNNISNALKEKLKEKFYFLLPKLEDSFESKDKTKKFIFSEETNLKFEAVLINNNERNTLCISSEIGCNYACQFCYTGKQKLQKKLKISEILGQFILIKEKIFPDKIDNIVFMGMGEPLDNFQNVIESISILNSPHALNFPQKKITIATCGLANRLKELAEKQIKISVSINAANNELRSKLMPVNKKYPLEELIKACKEYSKISKDKITFSYIMFSKINDSLNDAKEFYNLIKTIPCKVNLISFNTFPDCQFMPSRRETILKFQNYLINKNIRTHIRKSKGNDILAACGQLKC